MHIPYLLWNTFCYEQITVIVQQHINLYNHFRFSVREEESSGYIVGSISNFVKDAKYCLTEACGWSDYFTLHDSVGVIATSTVIDREKLSDPWFVLTLRGTHTSNSTQFQLYIEILVQDINDNSPYFSDSVQVIQVSENIGPISFDLLPWYDKDSGRNGQLKEAEVYNGDLNWPFDCILSSNGAHQTVILKVLKSLDYEAEREYNLTIRIQDYGNVSKSGTLNVLVEVQDQNDHKPEFNATNFTFKTPENQTVPFILGTVVATDLDDGDNGKITYFISTADTSSFSVDNTTGRISMTEVLDYETAPSLSFGKVGYSMALGARDNGQSPRFSTTLITVEVEDTNDNTPSISFHSPNMTDADNMRIWENIPINSYAATIIVQDKDSGINAECAVNIDSGAFGDFKLESNNGNLVLTADKIDREKHPVYDMVISVTDRGSPPLKSKKSLNIIVMDVNDNEPKFPKNFYNVSISEDIVINTPIANVSAHDDDFGKNSEIDYAIVSQGKEQVFSISNSGMISNIKHLDAESTSLYVLNASAKDRGEPSLQSYAIVNIHVLDINDNYPEFKKSLYTCSIPENEAINSNICSVDAKDKDSGDNGRITYTISSNTDFFNIDTQSGQISIKQKLDYELKLVHKLMIQAEDGGEPSKSAKCEVIITVTNVNDEPPLFDKNNYVINLPADKIPYQILQVTVSDKDRDDKVSFAFKSAPKDFKIDANTGIISLNSTLKNTANPVLLEVTATDDAGNTSPSAAKITVNVLENTNDLPIFDRALTFLTLKENADPGSLCIINASTHDPCKITYSLPSQNSYFSIDSITGSLSNSMPIDYEKNKSFEFDISGSCNSTVGFTKVMISIEDVNDNDPVCEDVQAITVSEGIPNNSVIFSMICADRDSSKNAQLYYKLSSPSFSIDEVTGDVAISKKLDREEAAVHKLSVQVCDNGSPENCIASSVKVIVSDVNDNEPRITEPFKFTVKEDVEENHEIAKVKAIDADIGDNSKLTFSLLNTVADLKLFGSGEIVVENRLDYERKTKYFLNVKVNDNGDPSLSVIKMIEVSVLDVNDNAPKFSSGRYTFHVEEHREVPHFLGSVSASDEDSGANKVVTYTLSKSVDYLTLNGSTGSLELVKSLDFEKNRGGLTVSVIAKDSGDIPLNSTATIFINVTDVNDHYPKFRSKAYSANVSEDAITGHKVIIVLASDDDGPNFNRILYHLQSDYFEIDSTSGEITTTQKLDFETKPRHEITVVAEDNGNPRLASNVTVDIFILDVNDNPPTFKDLIPNISVLESTPPGTIIQTLRAVDPDSGNNGKVSYFIVNEVPDGYFVIEEVTGSITLTRKLSFDDGQEYELTVKANDHGNPPKSSSAKLKVTVIDINDNAPVFTDDITNFDLYENVTINSNIFTISATDDDSKSAGEVRFNTSSSYFAIDRETGVVTVIADIDREKVSTLIMNICATDQAFPISSQLASCKDVTITVLDVNDNKPVFTDQNVRISVRENWSLNSVITNINATDADEGKNGIIHFEISSQTPSKCVTINHISGAIKPSRNFDYELEKVACSFTVQAKDSGSNPLSSEKTFELVIKDANDNKPVFLNSPKQRIVYLNGNVPRNSAMYKVLVKDRDSGKNAEVVFSITSPNFEIDSSTGVMRNINDITSSFRDQSFIVAATDLGNPPLASDMTLSVKYKESNSKPTCQHEEYHVTIKEDTAIGTSIVRLSCYDLDWSDFGGLSFTIIDGNINSSFDIHANGEIFSVKTLDYETVSYYTLIVLVSDSGVPSLQTLTQVKVTLQNVNDNTPSFDVPEVFIEIKELTPIDTVVTTLDAVDLDEDVLTYRIHDIQHQCKTYFYLDGRNLTLIKRLIYVDFINCFMVVTADDTIHTAEKKFVFSFIDEDNSKPRFYSSSEFTVTSTSSITGVAGALDDDHSDWDLSYSLVNNKRSSSYYINSTTGLIICPLSNCPTTVLAVRASGHSLNSDANVAITMSTSPSPGIFSQLEYTFNVYEDENKNAEVGLLGFRRKPGALKIEGGNLGRSFTVLKNGSIFVNGSLDREQKSSFILIIVGTLDGLSEFSTVFINILDVNDNSPQFNPTVQNIEIDESVSNGDIVGTVLAVDADDSSGKNGEVRYSLSSPSENFNVNPITGQISVEKLSSSSAYRFRVSANDLGMPSQKSNTLHVHVTVRRIVPEPTIQVPKMKIYAASPSNSVIGKISTTSTNEDYYSIALSKNNSWIKVYSSGYVLQKDPITKHDLTSIEARVIATSFRNPSSQVKADLSIPIIKSICDPNPCLNDGTCGDLVMEYVCSCRVGTEGKNCECVDADCTNGGVCFYHLDNQTTNCLCEDGAFRVKCVQSSNDSILIGAVAGGTVVVIVIFIIIIIFCFNRRKKKKKKKDLAQIDFNKAIDEVPITTSKRLKGQLRLQDNICLNPINVSDLNCKPPASQFSYTNHEYDANSPTALEVLAPTPRSLHSIQYPESDSGRSSNCADAVIFRKLYEQPCEEGFRRRDKDSGLAGSLNTICHYDVDINNRDIIPYNQNIDNINYLNDWRPHVQNIMNCLSLDDVDVDGNAPIKEEFV